MTAPGVFVDALPGLFPAGGIGRYVRDLADALAGEDAPPSRLVCTRDLVARARERFGADRLHVLPMAMNPLRLLMLSSAVTGIGLDRLYGDAAVLHSTVGHGPILSRIRLIEHVHDLTALDHPEWHPARTVMLNRLTVPAAVRSADVVLTHSEHVRRQVIARWRLDAGRTVTIPPPLSRAFRPVSRTEAAAHVARRFGIEGPFVLHVGTIEPRKNHVRLIGAFEQLRRAGFTGPLVLVGQDGWRVAPILRRLETSPDAGAIRRVRDADDGDLVALYGACTACAFPSIEEGFGMPLLESLACGAACVTSTHAALVELGEGCAVAVPAGDETALADALIALWKDPDHRARVAGPGPARASAYAFDRWAPRILALYRRELAAAAGTPVAPSDAVA